MIATFITMFVNSACTLLAIQNVLKLLIDIVHLIK